MTSDRVLSSRLQAFKCDTSSCKIKRLSSVFMSHAAITHFLARPNGSSFAIRTCFEEGEVVAVGPGEA